MCIAVRAGRDNWTTERRTLHDEREAEGSSESVDEEPHDLTARQAEEKRRAGRGRWVGV